MHRHRPWLRDLPKTPHGHRQSQRGSLSANKPPPEAIEISVSGGGGWLFGASVCPREVLKDGVPARGMVTS